MMHLRRVRGLTWYKICFDTACTGTTVIISLGELDAKVEQTTRFNGRRCR